MCLQPDIHRFMRFGLLVLGYLITVTSNAQIYTVQSFPHNSKEADFSAIFVGDDVLFCSSRTKKTTIYNEDSVEVFYTDLFISRTDGKGGYLPAEPLKGDVNGFYNEGHASISSDGTTLYYTANLIKKSGKNTKVDEYKLGIFIAKWNNGEWVKTGEFIHNSQNSRFSTAHPFITDNDSTLYFASNRPGGYGGSDLYKCVLTPNGWSEPINLGDNINEEGNEFFPFVNEEGTLFFTSDGRYDSEGMDIYCSFLMENNQYEEAFRLNSTINTSADELAYFEKPGSNVGLFSSNRDHELDDVFLFVKAEELERDCQPSEEIIWCYYLMDENMEKLDKSLPFVYQWDLGDGSKMIGEEIEYCYKEPGTYTVVLNALDTTTKMVFSSISETEIVVKAITDPVIYIPDTVYTGKTFQASLDLSMFKEFPIQEIRWSLNDERVADSLSFVYSLENEGYYQMRCEVIGPRGKYGKRQRACVYRNFYCTTVPENHIVIEPLVHRPKVDPVLVNMSKRPHGILAEMDSASFHRFYMLVIAESSQPLSFQSDVFKHVDNEISEIKTSKGYLYAIERTTNWKELIPLYTSLKAQGVMTSYAESFLDENYDQTLVRKGYYSPEAQAAHLAALASKAQVESTVSNNLQEESPKESVATVTTVPATVAPEIAKPNTPVNEVSVAQDSNASVAETAKEEITKAIAPVKPVEAPVAHAIASAEDNRKRITLYHIVLDSVSQRIPIQSAHFKSIDTEIAELKEKGGYKYTVFTAPSANHLEGRLEELKAKGFSNARIVSYDLQEFSDKLISVGKPSEKLELAKLNREFAKLKDVHFEYNSFEIQQTSWNDLNYIATIMSLEDGFALKINAHACNSGNSEYNKRLSQKRAQAVADYLISKGVSKERLIIASYGDAKPIASNFTVDGRSMNRRVEFRIVYNEKE
jgi:outer membrane protein OmpA-like peptidoglycan-associated protein